MAAVEMRTTCLQFVRWAAAGLLLALPLWAQAPAVGQLLIARARVPDGRFRHAVVLLVGQSSDGFAGLVLNQPTSAPLGRLFPGVASAQERSDVAFTGGPVDPARLFCLLQMDGPLREATLVLPGIYASTSLDLMHLALNARQPATAFRAFQGYAGWKPGQLRREIAAGLWTLRPASAVLIFDPDPATLWARLSTSAAEPARTATRAGDGRVLLLAVSRDPAVLAGGIQTSPLTAPGIVEVEPFAYVSASGDWYALPCVTGEGDQCIPFDNKFLSKAHGYSIVSSDGWGASVQFLPTTVGECYGIGGQGTYTGADLHYSAVAAASSAPFGAPPPVTRLGPAEAATFLKQVRRLLPKPANSFAGIRAYSTVLEMHKLYVLQWTLDDAARAGQEDGGLIFDIFVQESDRLRLAAQIMDDEQAIFATVRTTAGRDFLVTVTHNSEGHSFVVYGFRGGMLAVVFHGGENSC